MIDTRVKAIALALVFVLCAGGALAAGVSSKLKKSLQNSSVKVRIAAIVAVSKLKDPEARTLLEGMTSDSDPNVRAAAIEGLGTIGDPASLPIVTKMSVDMADPVAEVAKRTMTLLDARRLRVDMSDFGDLSGKNIPGLDTMLKKLVGENIEKIGGPAFMLVDDSSVKGYGVGLKIRSINQRAQGSANLVEVKCDMTIVELPGKALRLASSSTAAAGIEGTISPRMEAELAKDGVNACAPSLAKDFVDYMQIRMKSR